MAKRGWCFTINNYSVSDVHDVQSLLQGCTYGIYGYETGRNNQTPHLQGYLYCSNKISFSTVKEKLPTAHIEEAHGNAKQNRKYCSKEGSFHEFGVLPMQGFRNDITEFRDFILEGATEEDCIMAYPEMIAKYDRFFQKCRNIFLKKKANKLEQPEITVLIGEPGVGKTHTVYATHEPEEICKMECGDGSTGSIWWDNYDGEKVILVDDFHCNFKLDYMLRLLDKYPMKLNKKGSHTWRCATHIYITSNIHPNEWYPNCDAKHRKAVMRRLNTIKILERSQD